jgi:hypothetical protein
MKQILTFLLISSALLISCEMYPQDEYEEYYVVESYLIANNELPIVRVSKTVPANDEYNFEDAAVNDAIVQIRMLENGPQSDPVTEFDYYFSDTGIYRPHLRHRVQPLRTYELRVTFNDSDDIITAHTVVPDTFRITRGIQNSIVYQSEEQLNITVSESSYPGRQNIYVFNAISLSPVVENLTPFYAQLLEDSDTPDDDLFQLANNSSGILNEGNFEPNPDGTITIQYPWVGIAFFGENQIVANTIDDNVYDFVRSQQVQLGGSTLSPGEIQNVIYHVDGGIGVFGSLASDTVKTIVERPSF